MYRFALYRDDFDTSCSGKGSGKGRMQVEETSLDVLESLEMVCVRMGYNDRFVYLIDSQWFPVSALRVSA